MTYLVKKPLAKLFLRCLDATFLSSPQPPLARFERILVSQIAHIGDVVIATSILPLLREAYPSAEIGFLGAGASACVLRGHPLVDRVHVFDHWKLNRASLSLIKKIGVHQRSKQQAVGEISDYDIAIDLYPYFPNAIPLLSAARIPVRIGYTSGGFGPLLTHPVAWEDKEQHMAMYQADLLKVLGIQPVAPLVPRLAPGRPPSYALPSSYLLFHIGSGDAHKMWPVHKWRALVAGCGGQPILFTGRGRFEGEQIRAIVEGFPHAVNLCEQLSFEEWAYVIQQCRCLVAVDCAAVHLAAASHTPTVVIFSKRARLAHWRPQNPQAVVVDQEAEAKAVLQAIRF